MFDKEQNTLINVLYRPSKEVTEPIETFLKEVFKKTKINLKPFHIVGDFNLNNLGHDKCSKKHSLLKLFLPTINRPTRVATKTATAIDYTLTNRLIKVNFKTAIFKTIF